MGEAEAEAKHAALCTPMPLTADVAPGVDRAVTSLPRDLRVACYCCSPCFSGLPGRCEQSMLMTLSCSLGEGSHDLSELDQEAAAMRCAVALTMRKAMMGSTCRAFSMTKGSLVNSDMSCPCTMHARMSSVVVHKPAQLASKLDVRVCMLARVIAAGAQRQHRVQWLNSGARHPAGVRNLSLTVYADGVMWGGGTATLMQPAEPSRPKTSQTHRDCGVEEILQTPRG